MEPNRTRKRKNICLLPYEIDLLDAVSKDLGVASHSAAIVRLVRECAEQRGVKVPETVKAS